MKTNQEQTTTPDYPKWLRKELWQLHEAVSLLVELEPDDSPAIDHPKYIQQKIADETVRATWGELYGDVKDAMDLGVLKFYVRQSIKWIGERRVERSEFIQWAKKRNFPLPEAIKDHGEKEKPLEAKERTTYLNIIGAMLGLMLGRSKGGQRHSVYETQAAIIDALNAHYGDKSGISKRTLEQKFKEAKQNLDAY